jgi:hypothetical protein
MVFNRPSSETHAKVDFFDQRWLIGDKFWGLCCNRLQANQF